MFQFTAFAPVTRFYLFKIEGCPIRTPADQPLPAGPRNVSSLATSFIAIRSLRHPPDALLLRVYTTLSLLIDVYLYSADPAVCLFIRTKVLPLIRLSLQVKEQLVDLLTKKDNVLNKRQH